MNLHLFETDYCSQCGCEYYSQGLNFVLLEDNTYGVSLGSETNSNIVIPKEYRGAPVTVLLENAFYNCDYLVSLDIPSSILRVENNALRGCTNLIKVTIPNRVSEIGTYVLYGCDSLTEVTIPFIGANQDDTTNVFKYLFANSLLPTPLEKVTITNETIIHDRAFSGCSTIITIVLPQTITEICAYAFNECKKLTSINFPEGLLSIGEMAFYGCSNLKNIEIPSSVTHIGSSVFRNCNGIESMVIPFIGEKYDDEVNTHIGYLFGASDYTSNTGYISDSLIDVEILGGTFIGANAFSSYNGNCCVLNVTLPESIIKIGEGAFGSVNTSVLDNVYYNGTIESWCGIEFLSVGSNPAYHSTYFYINDEQGEVIHGENSYSLVTDIVIPETITNIGDYQFAGMNISTININSNVKTIGTKAFYDMLSLEKIYYDGTMDDWCRMSIGDTSNKNFIYSSHPMNYAKEFYILDSTGDVEYNDKFYSILQKIHLSSGITEIQTYQFYGFKNVTEVIIPNSVTSIGDYAFAGCDNLEVISLPFIGESLEDTSMTHLGYLFGALNSNYVPEKLKEVIITGETQVRINVFDNCSNIQKISLNEGITTIGSNAFHGCTNLSSIIIPNSVESIGNYAFEGCSSICEIKIPERVSEIGMYAFVDCTGLENLLISNYSATYQSYAFSGCTNLENVYYDGTIDDWCRINFSQVESNPVYYANKFYIKNELGNIEYNNEKFILLEEVTISSDITSIGEYQFYGFENLKKITLPTSVTSIGTNAFEGCTSLESLTIPFVGESLSLTTKKFIGYLFGASDYTDNSNYVPQTLKEVKVEGGNLYSNAFYGCTSIINLELSSGVTQINSGSMTGCDSLEKLTIPYLGYELQSDTGQFLGYLFGANTYLSNKDYVPLNLKEIIVLDGSIARQSFSDCENISSIILPKNLLEIEYGAFKGCTSLLSVSIPATVETIAGAVFMDCINLKNVYFEENSLLNNLGSSVFSNCQNLREIKIPEGVKILENSTFEGCSSLETIILPQQLSKLYQSVFKDCVSLSNIELPETISNIGAYMFQNCISLTEIEFLGNITSIPGSICYGCTALSSVVIPESVTSISSYAFYNCTNLADINLPSNLEYITEYAFYNCSKLTNVILPSTMIHLGSYAFYNCSLIDNIIIPTGITEINEYTFYNCTNIEKFEILGSVTKIGEYALYNCSSIFELVIPSSVTSIGEFALSGCAKLNKLSLPFVGNKNTYYTDTYQYPLGYIFGTSSYEGGTATKQYYYGSSTTSRTSSTYYIPSNLQYITVLGGYVNYGAFYNCTNLVGLDMTNCANISSTALYNCSGLNNLILPFVGNNSYTTAEDTYQYPFGYIFGTSSYEGGTATKQYYYGSSTTSTTSSTYYIPTGLESVTVVGGNLNYGAFYGCSTLVNIDILSEITNVGDYAFYNCSNTEIYISSEKITSIGSYAFYNCTSLTSLFTTKITYINAYAFYGCASLCISDLNNVLTIESYAFYNCNNLIEISIEKGTSFGEYSFAECDNLYSVTTGSSLTLIENNAFQNNTALQKFNTEVDGDFVIVSDVIGSHSFANNIGIVNLEIETSEINYGAFNNTINLESIKVPFVGKSESETSITSGVFGYIFGDKNTDDDFYITEGILSSAIAYKTSDDFGYTTQYLTDSALVMYNAYHFAIPKSLKKVSITLQNNIPENAFYCCDMIEEINLPVYYTINIGDSAFRNCESLKQMNQVVNDEVKEGKDGQFNLPKCEFVGAYSFANCHLLQEFVWADSQDFYDITIESYAFGNCFALEYFIIPLEMTTINSNTFYYCSSLKYIVIDQEITSINESAFEGCSLLTDIYYTRYETQWAEITIIESGNETLLSSTVHYGSNGPTTE